MVFKIVLKQKTLINSRDSCNQNRIIFEFLLGKNLEKKHKSKVIVNNFKMKYKVIYIPTL